MILIQVFSPGNNEWMLGLDGTLGLLANALAA